MIFFLINIPLWSWGLISTIRIYQIGGIIGCSFMLVCCLTLFIVGLVFDNWSYYKIVNDRLVVVRHLIYKKSICLSKISKITSSKTTGLCVLSGAPYELNAYILSDGIIEVVISNDKKAKELVEKIIKTNNL